MDLRTEWSRSAEISFDPRAVPRDIEPAPLSCTWVAILPSAVRASGSMTFARQPTRFHHPKPMERYTGFTTTVGRTSISVPLPFGRAVIGCDAEQTDDGSRDGKPGHGLEKRRREIHPASGQQKARAQDRAEALDRPETRTARPHGAAHLDAVLSTDIHGLVAPARFRRAEDRAVLVCCRRGARTCASAHCVRGMACQPTLGQEEIAISAPFPACCAGFFPDIGTNQVQRHGVIAHFRGGCGNALREFRAGAAPFPSRGYLPEVASAAVQAVR